MSLSSNEQPLANAESGSPAVHAAADSAPAIPRLGLGRRPAFEEAPRDELSTNELDDHEFLAGDDDTLGVAGLHTIDLLGETVRLFRQTKRLLSKVLVDAGTPPNQKAQVANSLAGLLKTLVVQQTDLYNAERLKRLEQVVIRLVRDMPVEQQEAFMREYEAEVNVR